MCWHPGKGLSPVRETALPVGMHTIIRRLETYRQYPGNIYSFQHKEHTIKQCKTLHLYLNYIPFGYEWLTCSISGCLFRKIIIIIIILPWTPEGVPLPFPSRIVCFLAQSGIMWLTARIASRASLRITLSLLRLWHFPFLTLHFQLLLSVQLFNPVLTHSMFQCSSWLEVFIFT